MICPFCSFKNIPGSDECKSCSEDLSSFDGASPKSKFERVLMEDPLSRLKPRQPLSVSGKTSALEAAHTMNTGKVGAVLVMEGEKLAGILTERDLIFKALGKKPDLSKVLVSDIMTQDPTTLAEEDTLAHAINQMSVGSYRHIPITRKGKPVGIISVRDVVAYLTKLFP
ncbi:MAG: CBS domain-containing protein [Deltaproteobacteria bacterium]|nr:CBS domain-containing protein [Deltaproteobacteria bacterium]